MTERPGTLRIIGKDGAKSDAIAGPPNVFNVDQGGLLDVRLAPDGQVWLLEANANPYISNGHDFAESAGKSGLSYTALIQRLVETAPDGKLVPGLAASWAVVGVVIQAGTLSLNGIVAAQANGSIFGFSTLGNPFILTQFVGFAIFLAAVLSHLTNGWKLIAIAVGGFVVYALSNRRGTPYRPRPAA